jgi:CBS domain-containing protein
MPKLREIMSRDLVTVDYGASVRDAARLMAEHEVGDVLVTQGDRLAGIVTDRDLVVKGIATDRGSDASIVDVMTPDIVSCGPDAEIEEAARLMADNRIRRLPVVEGGRAVGIVSLGDISTRAQGNMDARALEEVSKPGGPHST